MKRILFAVALLLLLPGFAACEAKAPSSETTAVKTQEATEPVLPQTTTETPATTVTEPVTTAAQPKKDKIRIACIGDSLTYGTGSSNPSVFSYPVQLQKYLNAAQSETLYTVLNYGKPSAYAINNKEYDFTYPSKNSNAYTESEQYKNSLNCQPDIVIIMLGTNDAYAAAANKNVSEKYTASLEKIVDTYLALESTSEVILMLCPSRFDNATRLKSVTNIIHPAIRDVAERKEIRLIDAYTMTNEALADRATAVREKVFNSDGVHLSDKGYEMLAELIGRTILGEND